MKQTIKNSRISGYLEKMYRQLNKDFFGGELEEVFITIQSSKGAHGHVTTRRIWNSRTGLSRYELNLGAGTLDRPIENVVSTMLHEMVHVYHLMHDIQDCSRNGTYHNKKFKEKAETVGLVIDHDPKYGWTVTSPSDSLVLYIADMGWTEIEMNRDEGVTFSGTGRSGGASSPGSDEEPPKRTSSTRKLQCPCCKNSCRATKEIFIICGDCMERMLEV